MQGTYTVSAVASEPARTYPNKHGGNLAVWRLRLKDAVPDTPDGLFELHKKEGNPPPAAGDQVEVERSQQGEFNGEPFVRLFLAYKQDGGRSSSSSTGGGSRQSDGPGLQWRSAPFERGAEHPRNEARAIHTSALSAAPAYYELLRTEGVLDQAADKASALNTLAGIVQWLEGGYGPVLDAVSGPSAAAVQTAGNGSGGQQEIPADRTDLAPAAAPADDASDVPF